MSWISLCELDALRSGEGKFVQVDGFPLAVFLHENQVYVLDDACPHAGGSLSGGMIEDFCAVCPLHGWSFHLATGELRDAPGVKIFTYKTRLLQREGKPTLVQADLPRY